MSVFEFFSAPLCLACLLMASGCDDDDASGSGAGTGGSAEICVPNDGDGRTQCGGNTCEAGERCTESGLLQCLPGCLGTLNCGSGQWCDLRTAEPGQPGLCRSVDDPACGEDPDPGETQAGETSEGADETGGPACPDVQGNYSVSLSLSSPEDCEVFFDNERCSVSQDECDLVWGCDGDLSFLLVPGPVSMSGVYETSGTLEGFSYACEVTFLLTGSFVPALNWSCSVGQAGEAVLCEGTGSL